MKSQVVFVVGLPGAGKTEYIRSQYPEIVWSVFDDYFRESLDNNSLKNGVQFDKLIDDIRNNKSCVISDIHFCRVWALEEALKVLKDEFQTFQPTVIFFSNEPEKCAKNVNTRDRDRETKDRELGLIKELSLDYKPDNKHSWQMIRDVWESK